MEAVLAGFLAILIVLLDVVTTQPWQPLALDLLACAAAAATPRWPRTAGFALGAVLVVYIFIPPSWGTLGEYALLIPILGTGMRGQRRARTAMSIAYFVILCAISLTDTPGGRNPVIGWLLWAVLIGVLWLIGNVFVATTEAQRRARKAELILQRQALARSLHDTVARSLTRVVMGTERARLRGAASHADLALIAEAAVRSTDELRWLMTLLRDPADGSGLPANRATPLDRALDDAQRELTQHGFTVVMSVEGSLGQLVPEQMDVLGEVAAEAAGNIIKHAESDTACAIIVDISDERIELVFVSRRRPGSGDGRTDSMGLANIRERLARIHGELSIEAQADQWATRIQVPLSTASRPPERAA
jgi:signal transduction histidine kinase